MRSPARRCFRRRACSPRSIPNSAPSNLPSRRRVLLSDTVGFIRNLPHTLVTSFRATLEEVAQAEVLLHVRDASSTYGEEQKTQVEKVLGELDCLSKPRIEVLNKIDLLPEDERAALLLRTNSILESAAGPTRQLATSRSDANPPKANSPNPQRTAGDGAGGAVALSALTGIFRAA